MSCASIVEKLSSEWIWRHNEIQVLQAHLNSDLPTESCLYVYGRTNTGKTCIVRSVLEANEIPYFYYNMQQNASERELVQQLGYDQASCITGEAKAATYIRKQYYKDANVLLTKDQIPQINTSSKMDILLQQLKQLAEKKEDDIKSVESVIIPDFTQLNEQIPPQEELRMSLEAQFTPTQLPEAEDKNAPKKQNYKETYLPVKLPSFGLVIDNVHRCSRLPFLAELLETLRNAPVKLIPIFISNTIRGDALAFNSGLSLCPVFFCAYSQTEAMEIVSMRTYNESLVLNSSSNKVVVLKPADIVSMSAYRAILTIIISYVYIYTSDIMEMAHIVRTTCSHLFPSMLEMKAKFEITTIYENLPIFAVNQIKKQHPKMIKTLEFTPVMERSVDTQFCIENGAFTDDNEKEMQDMLHVYNDMKQYNDTLHSISSNNTEENTNNTNLITGNLSVRYKYVLIACALASYVMPKNDLNIFGIHKYNKAKRFVGKRHLKELINPLSISRASSVDRVISILRCIYDVELIRDSKQNTEYSTHELYEVACEMNIMNSDRLNGSNGISGAYSGSSLAILGEGTSNWVSEQCKSSLKRLREENQSCMNASLPQPPARKNTRKTTISDPIKKEQPQQQQQQEEEKSKGKEEITMPWLKYTLVRPALTNFPIDDIYTVLLDLYRCKHIDKNENRSHGLGIADWMIYCTTPVDQIRNIAKSINVDFEAYL